jgi:hypothetical protein
MVHWATYLQNKTHIKESTSHIDIVLLMDNGDCLVPRGQSRSKPYENLLSPDNKADSKNRDDDFTKRISRNCISPQTTTLRRNALGKLTVFVTDLKQAVIMHLKPSRIYARYHKKSNGSGLLDTLQGLDNILSSYDISKFAIQAGNRNLVDSFRIKTTLAKGCSCIRN